MFRLDPGGRLGGGLDGARAAHPGLPGEALQAGRAVAGSGDRLVCALWVDPLPVREVADEVGLAVAEDGLGGAGGDGALADDVELLLPETDEGCIHLEHSGYLSYCVEQLFDFLFLIGHRLVWFFSEGYDGFIS